MPRLLFPFAWGAPSTDTVIVVTTPPFWTKDTPGTVAWQASRANILPRFQHIYPEEATITWNKQEPV